MSDRQSDIPPQAFPVLTDELIDLLRPFGEVRATHPGDVLYEVGDATYPLVVVLSGQTAIVDRSDESDQVFVMIGSDPCTDWLHGAVDLDERGFVVTGLAAELGSGATSPYETSLPGVFAVGDVRSGSIKRVASAVGEGSVVVQAVHQYLAATGNGER